MSIQEPQAASVSEGSSSGQGQDEALRSKKTYKKVKTVNTNGPKSEIESLYPNGFLSKEYPETDGGHLYVKGTSSVHAANVPTKDNHEAFC